jgi:hypothetical protein
VRGRRATAVVASFVAVVALSGTFTPLSAAAPSEWAYWWKLQSGVGPTLDSPPFVPRDGLWIAAEPSGDQAISAVRYVGPSGVKPVLLTLTVADARGSGEVRACAAKSDWSAVSAGAWNGRPASDCSRSATGVASTDGKKLTFDLGSLRSGSSFDIVLTPSSGTFSIAFEAPNTRAVSTTKQVAPPTALPIVPAEASALPRPSEEIAAVPIPSPEIRAAPPVGVPAQTFDQAPQAFPAPRRANSARGTRQPFALLAALLVAATWLWRHRIASRNASGHELSQPIGLDRDAQMLQRADSLLATP